MFRDRVYIAGALNADSCGYIINLARMEDFALKVQRDLDATPVVPGEDFLRGLMARDMNYGEYVLNSMADMLSCDAVFVVPYSEDSSGTNTEIEMALHKEMPVFHELEELEKWLNRPIIITISGRSGTGKTSIAEYIEDSFDINMIRSYTDREPRPNDVSHTFVSQAEFDKFMQERRDDMTAFTRFGANRYCCFHEDVTDTNTYVIDDRGITELTTKHSDKYRLIHIRVKKKDVNVEPERIARDDEMFYLPDKFFDVVIDNNGSLDDLFEQVDGLLGEIQHGDILM